MDEEELLLETSSTFDVSNLSELDESAILGDDDLIDEASTKDEVADHHEEAEELDYDEELEAEKAPRSSKFTSERTVMQRTPSQHDISLKKEFRNQSDSRRSVAESGAKNEITPSLRQTRTANSRTVTTARAQKVFINPHHKGVIRPQTNLHLPWETAALVPNIPILRLPAAIPQHYNDPVLSQVSRPLPFPIVPSSSADFSRPPPQIVPLPNYSTPPPSIYPNQFKAESVSSLPSVGQWDQMVEGFLRRTTARSRSHISRSSRSSFSSSRSRSRSYLSHSTSSSVSTRSSSRSPYRRIRSRSHRSSSRRPSNYRSRLKNEIFRRHPGSRSRHSSDSHREARHHSDRRRSRVNDAAKQEKTIECAKAIGLDSEYLTKLEEQKKMREEILRKKEERRIQTVQRLGGPVPISGGKSARYLDRDSYPEERRSDRARRMDEERSRRRESERNRRMSSEIRNGKKDAGGGTNSATDHRKGAKSGRSEVAFSKKSDEVNKTEHTVTEIPNLQLQATLTAGIHHAKRENQQNVDKVRKKKAYLAVVISSSNQAPVNMERIRIIAETVGPTKKVWKSAENTVSLIFQEHESAKKFMFHYHNRVIHGVQLAVTLQKLFANLAELP